MSLPRVHLVLGVLTFLTFVGTGVYMRLGFPDLYGDDPAVRFLYRANHIYLLLAALLHVALGLREPASTGRRILPKLGSALTIAGPFLLVAAFFIEPSGASPERPLTSYAMHALLAGTALHAIAFLRARPR